MLNKEGEHARLCHEGYWGRMVPVHPVHDARRIAGSCQLLGRHDVRPRPHARLGQRGRRGVYPPLYLRITTSLVPLTRGRLRLGVAHEKDLQFSSASVRISLTLPKTVAVETLNLLPRRHQYFIDTRFVWFRPGFLYGNVTLHNSVGKNINYQ